MLKQENITIGIIGYGVIGIAFKKWIEKNTKCKVAISDPPKNINDDLSNCNVFFIGIHIPTENDGTQDLTVLENIITGLPSAPIFIRTTLIPGTTDALCKKFSKKIYFMPEFLTERTAYEDFQSQAVIVTGEEELLNEIFKDKKRFYMNNMEAEISKYTHNVFGAVKVTYFNSIYKLCKDKGIDYNKVLEGTLISGYISPNHTNVPGPDGCFGYGGKCFPKDIAAFASFNIDNELNSFLNKIIEMNYFFRNNKK